MSPLPDAGLLVTIGDLVEDVVVHLGSDPVRTGDDNPATVSRVSGGSAANVAALATRVGGRSRFVGRVGEDRLGEALVDDLAAHGVDVRVQRAGRTGCIVVLVDGDGERTMFPDRAAALDLADVPDAWVSDAAIVHAPAYFLETRALAGEVTRLLRVARVAGAAVSVDASSAELLERVGVREVHRELAALRPDYLFANRDEARALRLADAEPLAATVIVKNGADEVVVHADGARRAYPVPPVDAVVDSTGAGDAFAGGFLSAVLAGRDEHAAVLGGCALAGQVLNVAGSRLG